MCNGGEGRTLKPCCDAALASSKAYISNGPAKAHSLPTLPPPPSALPPLNPSLPGPPRLALAPASLLLLHPSLPLPPFLSVPRSLARSRARAPASTIPVLGVLLLPHSWVPSRRAAERRLGGRWNTRGPIQITGLPSYPGSFFLSPSRSLPSPSLSLFLRSHPPPLLFLRLLSPSFFVSSSFFISLASVLLNREANSCYISFIYMKASSFSFSFLSLPL